MNIFGQPTLQRPPVLQPTSAPPRASAPPPRRARRAGSGSLARRILLHAVFLVIAIGCFIAYEHYHVAGRSGTALACLAGGAIFAFAPVRDILQLVFGVQRRVLHVVHGVGALALLALPLTGVVSGTPVLTHTAMAPFAIMGAAQAVMHQNHPRNAKQAAALQRFAASLPEVAQFANGNALSSPESARRAVIALSDIIGKAQALGETELQADPNFQSALRQTSTRYGVNMELDAVDLMLNKLAANPATASAVPRLRAQLATARRTLASAEQHR